MDISLATHVETSLISHKISDIHNNGESGICRVFQIPDVSMKCTLANLGVLQERNSIMKIGKAACKELGYYFSLNFGNGL